MIRNSRPNLFVLAITVIFLLLLPFVNSTIDPTKITSIEKIIKTATIKNHLHDRLKPETLNNDYEEQAMKYILEDILKSYPNRRASSFHAMRGKRLIKTA